MNLYPIGKIYILLLENYYSKVEVWSNGKVSRQLLKLQFYLYISSRTVMWEMVFFLWPMINGKTKLKPIGKRKNAVYLGRPSQRVQWRYMRENHSNPGLIFTSKYFSICSSIFFLVGNISAQTKKIEKYFVPA